MKFFNWVQTKINAGQANKKPNAVPPAASSSSQAKVEAAPNEKFSDWSNGLLTIGTFGNRDQREEQEIQERVQIKAETSNEIQESSSPDHDLAEFTAEEVGQLQRELTRLLKRKPTSAAKAPPPPPPPLGKGGSEDDHAVQDMPLDRFLNCPSSLDVDRTISNRYSIHSDQYRADNEEDIDRTIRAIIGRCKQVSMESKKKSIAKKSISFLLKKMFVCTSGFVPPTPSLRDALQESRMEKLLRTMLSKKMYPQNGSRASSTKRFLVDARTHNKAEKDDDESQSKPEGDGGCKWVKTDSEYIVLDLD